MATSKTHFKDWETLLYNHPSGAIKGLAAMGLARKSNKDIFKHLKYALSQDLNVAYYMTCQKLGGFFLYELNYRIPGNLEIYFSENEVEEIKNFISGRKFICN
ncbi:MAG: hypothetical protein ACI9XO_000509 [Paraglaciecola sp.]|jgi:hypothetical protein